MAKLDVLQEGQDLIGRTPEVTPVDNPLVAQSEQQQVINANSLANQVEQKGVAEGSWEWFSKGSRLAVQSDSFGSAFLFNYAKQAFAEQQAGTQEDPAFRSKMSRDWVAKQVPEWVPFSERVLLEDAPNEAVFRSRLNYLVERNVAKRQFELSPVAQGIAGYSSVAEIASTFPAGVAAAAPLRAASFGARFAAAGAGNVAAGAILDVGNAQYGRLNPYDVALNGVMNFTLGGVGDAVNQAEMMRVGSIVRSANKKVLGAFGKTVDDVPSVVRFEEVAKAVSAEPQAAKAAETVGTLVPSESKMALKEALKGSVESIPLKLSEDFKVMDQTAKTVRGIVEDAQSRLRGLDLSGTAKLEAEEIEATTEALLGLHNMPDGWLSRGGISGATRQVMAKTFEQAIEAAKVSDPQEAARLESLATPYRNVSTGERVIETEAPQVDGHDVGDVSFGDAFTGITPVVSRNGGTYKLDFENPVDKALYLVGQEAKTSIDETLMGELRAMFPGQSDEAIRQAGRTLHEAGVEGVLDELGPNKALPGETPTVKLPTLQKVIEKRAATAVVKAVESHITKSFGKPVKELLKNGSLKVVHDAREIPGIGKDVDPKAVAGVYMPHEGRGYLVASNLSPKDVDGVLLHEVGVHGGMKAYLGEEPFKKVLSGVMEKVAAGDESFVAAKKLVDEAVSDGMTKAEDIAEEVLAYVVQEAPHHTFVQKIVSAIRRAVYQLSNGRIDHLTDGDYRAMALSALSGWSKVAGQPTVGVNPLYAIKVWHGTWTRDIKEFSTKFINSGEGAQVFGWGLYFAESKKIAEWYRETVTASKGTSLFAAVPGSPEVDVASVNGFRKFFKEYTGFRFNIPEDLAVELRDLMEEVANGAKADTVTRIRSAVGDAYQKESNAVDALKTFEADVNNPRWDAATKDFFKGQLQLAKDDLEGLRKYMAALPEATGKLAEDIASGRLSFRSVTPEGGLYEVSLKYDEDMVPVWERYLGEQPEAVQKAILSIQETLNKKALNQDELDSLDGQFGFSGTFQQGYKELIKAYEWHIHQLPDGHPLRLGVLKKETNGYSGQKWASMVLKEAGIPGHKYLDGGSRGKGIEPSFNHVVYADESAELKALYSRAKANTAKAFDLEDRNLLVQHNISEDGVRLIAKLGGYPAMSMGVVRDTEPLVGFGGVSLFGSKGLLSKDVSVYAGDAYTGRMPKLTIGDDGEIYLREYNRNGKLVEKKATAASLLKKIDTRRGGEVTQSTSFIKGATAERLSSIEQIKAAAQTRLGKEADFDRYMAEALKGVTSLLNRADEIGGVKRMYRSDDDLYMIAEEVVKAVESGKTELADIKKAVLDKNEWFGKNGYSTVKNLDKVEDSDWERTVNSVVAAMKTPRGYFEAKAHRVVKFKEFDTAIVQTSAGDDVKEILKNSGLKVIEVADEAEYNKAVAGLNDLKFSRVKNPQVDSPEFKKWFGESKLVDRQGNPKVFYHGTNEDISTFSPQPAKRADPKTGGPAKGPSVEAFFFSAEPRVASQYAAIRGDFGGNANVIPVYLKMENPLNLADDLDNWKQAIVDRLMGLGFSGKGFNEFRAAVNKRDDWARAGWKMFDDPEFIQQAKDKGYDGVITPGTGIGELDYEYIVFEPTQIKSAIGNSGAFDAGNPSILFSKVKEEIAKLDEEWNKGGYRKAGLLRPNAGSQEGAVWLPKSGKVAMTHIGFKLPVVNKNVSVRVGWAPADLVGTSESNTARVVGDLLLVNSVGKVDENGKGFLGSNIGRGSELVPETADTLRDMWTKASMGQVQTRSNKAFAEWLTQRGIKPSIKTDFQMALAREFDRELADALRGVPGRE